MREYLAGRGAAVKRHPWVIEGNSPATFGTGRLITAHVASPTAVIVNNCLKLLISDQFHGLRLAYFAADGAIIFGD